MFGDEHYMVHNMDNTKPYPDVMEMLEELKNRGKNIAVDVRIQDDVL